MTRVLPFVDLYAQYETIKDEIDQAIASVIRRSAFIRGEYVERFEEEFAAAVDADHCVSCANGTDALYIAMRALGIRPGDEVITTAHSWISTAESITQAGGSVVFCDTDRRTYTIDPLALEAKVTSRTVGIIPVHLFGQPADMEAIMAIADRHGLWVLEDCAQAHLAKYAGRHVGTFGVAGTFSFYPGKNLGAMGDAGAIVTRDAALARRMAMFARHGGLTKGEHECEGINSRLDGIQAAILSVKLKYLSEWTLRRQVLAQRYDALLSNLDSTGTPYRAPGREHVHHLYVIQHADRDALAAHLRNNGVSTVVNYRTALPFLPAYQRLGHHPHEFPRAYANQSRILSLPLYPELNEADIERVVDAIATFDAANVGVSPERLPDAA
jgi:dTDP-4-amino-4,6-dideoxygalactose transaminase